MSTAKHKNIFLIGPMGAGKSSVGKYLAQQLNMDFYDTDEEIENRTGVDMGWIFDLEGEIGFRKRETDVIRDLTLRSGIVLATGGGSILEAENRKLLKQNGTVIYLSVALSYQHHRTLNDSRRPLLRVSNRQETLEKLYHERQPLYLTIMDLEVVTDNRSIRDVTDDILKWLRKK